MKPELSPEERAARVALNESRRIDSRNRRRTAWELRCHGKSYEQIGDAMGITASGAFRLVQRFHDSMDRDSQDSIRAQILTELRTIMDSAESSKIKLTAIAQISRVCGLDQIVTITKQDASPLKIELSTAEGSEIEITPGPIPDPPQ